MAKFFAQRVIDNKTKFDVVPPKLKDRVRECLIEMGREDLIA